VVDETVFHEGGEEYRHEYGPTMNARGPFTWLRILLISTAGSIAPNRVELVAKCRGRSLTDVYTF
jgi:hypothetical protein